mgnify:CR=1 FL=1
MTLYSAEEDAIKDNNYISDGEFATLSHRAEETGTYYLAVDPDSSAEGSYELTRYSAWSNADSPSNDFWGTHQTAQYLDPSASHVASSDTGEHWYYFHAEGGSQLEIQLKPDLNSGDLDMDLYNAEDPGNHGSTFSGGPVVCAAANATLDTIVEDDVPGHAAQVGEYLQSELRAATEEHDLPVREVRGLGLMIGVQVKRGANRVLKNLAIQEQVLALPAGRTVVRLLPPLVVDESHADQFVDSFVEVLG